MKDSTEGIGRTQISVRQKGGEGLDAERCEERRVAYGTSERRENGCTGGYGQDGEQGGRTRVGADCWLEQGFLLVVCQ